MSTTWADLRPGDSMVGNVSNMVYVVLRRDLAPSGAHWLWMLAFPADDGKYPISTFWQMVTDERINANFEVFAPRRAP